MKISSQSSLLAAISPSRLTEEILKIIHSEKAADIVDLLDKMGLYAYLQPQAALLMRKNANFRKNYLQGMSALKSSENRRGQALGTLFCDYLESVAEWKPGPIENFKEIYAIARTFVLPMNPPRFELEQAVKKFLASRGIIIKRPLPKPVPEEDSQSKPKRKRRRRRKGKAVSAQATQ
jgi:poly(A) polymerase